MGGCSNASSMSRRRQARASAEESPPQRAIRSVPLQPWSIAPSIVSPLPLGKRARTDANGFPIVIRCAVPARFRICIAAVAAFLFARGRGTQDPSVDVRAKSALCCRGQGPSSKGQRLSSGGKGCCRGAAGYGRSIVVDPVVRTRGRNAKVKGDKYSNKKK